MSESALTDDDYAKLRDIHENGPHAYTYWGNDTPHLENLDDPEPQDGRGLTIQQCNAIRAAADDGLTYREIASLFTFIGCGTAANRHATGQCQHGDGDYPPVPSRREPGPQNPIDAEECAWIRDQYRNGYSCNKIGDAIDRAQSAAYRHVTGNCSHDTPEGNLCQ